MDNKELQFPEIPVQKSTTDDLKNRIGLQKKKNSIRKELHERGILPKVLTMTMTTMIILVKLSIRNYLQNYSVSMELS